MIPVIPAGQDVLDLGRHPTTLAEIESRFVTDPQFAASTTRAKIWSDWLNATAFLRSVVPVSAAWIGGSFTTTKLDPDDVDSLYIVDDATLALAKVDPTKNRVLGQFAGGKLVRAATGLQVDTYLCAWRQVVDPARRNGLDKSYYEDRGHWDDWWQRRRMVSKTAPLTRADALRDAVTWR
ncbi:hypothetical protein GCM10025881_37400 [Pseudolysinimonas kribbensis]|uniref:Nucleotidyltransferase family protein n=1 Tax=Pseudolysinimonas kribbensis TaxID=433641 RepID=A0ABQ6KBB1_9MICO|nr:hypothetical protein [Pseudolysinimonas kribbensis]GMA96916.1 hypothetical protein GCM10025881_37400 [Pseudolysinimonas kribbensis]